MRKTLVSVVLALAALPSAAAIREPAGLAPALRASAAEEPSFMLSASGVHIFECRPVADASGRHVWSFTAPDATLYDAGRSVGTHTTANLWESSSDRSSVAGVVRALQPAGADNLPWAMMRAQPIGASGLFAGVSSVQRVNTSGGAAPLGGCSAETAGAEARVPFTADYFFYKPRGTG